MDYYTRHRIVTAEGQLDYRLAPGRTAEIVDIEVASPSRRRGFGRQMLEQMIADLPSEMKTIYAFTSAQNRIAHQWYRACGFTLTFVPSFYASMGEDAYCCVKELK